VVGALLATGALEPVAGAAAVAPALGVGFPGFFVFVCVSADALESHVAPRSIMATRKPSARASCLPW
jgi:hypothetical protein